MSVFFKLILFAFYIVGPHAAADELQSKVDLSFTNCAQLKTGSTQFVYDKACVEQFYNNHPMTFTKLKDWQEVIKKPISDRLVSASLEMIQYMTLDNLLWDYPYENIKAVTDKQLITAAQQALNNLPTPMKKYIDEHFYGFMLVSGVGWTGFASSILESPGISLKPGAVIIINADNINKNLNDWLVFREETTFQGQTTQLRMSYSKPNQQNTLADNLRHFLIHETAHLIVNASPSIHPDFKYRNKPVPITEFEKWAKKDEPLDQAFPFLTTSWLLSLGQTADLQTVYLLERNVPAAIQPIVKSKKIKFYSTDQSSKFTDSEAIELYNHLNDTCFPSLYSMVDYSEDFAETVTHYFMSYVEGYQYNVDLVLRDTNTIVANFKDDSWNDPKCSNKLKFMNELFLK